MGKLNYVVETLIDGFIFYFTISLDLLGRILIGDLLHISGQSQIPSLI